ncbi:MAG: cyclic pyranopterin monophosphate synthase MoaC [bacterium]|nr:cyclic pyranopterin monophosphate synthase MoaC [bacterium]
MTDDDQPTLSHLDSEGRLRMVDVSQKTVTVRTAVASARVTMLPEVLHALCGGKLPKGDALAAARVAGTLAAKKTGELIPLCHPLPIDWVEIDFDPVDEATLSIRATVRTSARTGVEMEALTAATVAALTLYDMAKAADRSISIGPIRLERKEGGKSGTYQRTGEPR